MKSNFRSIFSHVKPNKHFSNQTVDNKAIRSKLASALQEVKIYLLPMCFALSTSSFYLDMIYFTLGENINI